VQAIAVQHVRTGMPHCMQVLFPQACHCMDVCIRTYEPPMRRLLGPNGAGKSTSINMMTGFLEATAGQAYIDGKDISTDMADVYQVMGVCPQHDLLWETLTAREHLNFYGRLKGLKRQALTDAVDDVLRCVKLYDVAGKRLSKYSGGARPPLHLLCMRSSPQPRSGCGTARVSEGAASAAC
jgi:ABC-type Na+ transport system ATPase subunit NatA